MGTPAIIALKCEDTVTWASVNYDGYIAHTGRMLVENYNDAESAAALLALGDLSSLDKSIECPDGHSFANRIPGYTVAYGRDRGESDVDSQIADWFMFLRANKNIIRYVFEGDAWFVCRRVKTTGTFIEQFELFRVGDILDGLI